MFRLIIGCLLFIFVNSINAKVFINVLNEGENNSLESDICYGNVIANYTAKIKEIQNNLNAVTNRWEQELSLQRKVLQDVRSTLLKKSRLNNTMKVANCDEALRATGTDGGVFLLEAPSRRVQPFEVYCLKDPNNGPAWILIQRRQDGSVDFYRGWFDYKHGFGDLMGEFWLGLKNIYALTASKQYELWIQLEDFEDQKRYARYDSFALGDENASYGTKILGKFTGDGGDSMNTHQGQKFTTKDSDNDNNQNGNCARQYTGAWWYRSCHNSNLNGQYLHAKPKSDDNGKGIEWFTWHGHYSLKYVHMAIRPVS